MVKNPSANAGDTRDTSWIHGWENPLEWKMATDSSILAWKIPGREAWRAADLEGHKEQTGLSMHMPCFILIIPMPFNSSFVFPWLFSLDLRLEFWNKQFSYFFFFHFLMNVDTSINC